MNRAFSKGFSSATNERGAVLVTGLLFILVLTILGLSAMMNTVIELKISANDRSAKQVFYIAEGGLEDARSRLQTGASHYPIYDPQPANPDWRAFIGTETGAAALGYQSGNGSHFRYDRLDPSLDYAVMVAHKLDDSGRILKWGDSDGDGVPEENTVTGQNIYVLTSEGHTPVGAEKKIRAEVTRVPVITTPAALYTKALTTIQGTSTYVEGTDHCGSNHVPGIVTMATVTQKGNPTISGLPSPIVENSPQNMQVDYLIKYFSKSARYAYDVESATLTGMNWGSPSPGALQHDATNCSQQNIVYFDTHSTYVKLTGGTSGCGILLVEGDLHVHGGFQWYGVILVTGSVVFSGGGNKNVTGSMLAGGTVSAHLVSGDVNIVYCSRAILEQTEYLPLITIRWVELFS